MIKIYVYYHEDKIYKISGNNEPKEGLEIQELTFEAVPTEQQIIKKFKEEKGI